MQDHSYIGSRQLRYLSSASVHAWRVIPIIELSLLKKSYRLMKHLDYLSMHAVVVCIVRAQDYYSPASKPREVVSAGSCSNVTLDSKGKPLTWT